MKQQILRRAGQDIVNGASFDNNIVCICEKEVLVVASVADRLKQVMQRHGAYELTKDQIEKLTKLVVAEAGGPGKEGFPNKKVCRQTRSSDRARHRAHDSGFHKALTL